MSDIVDRTGYLTPSFTFSSLRLHRPPTRAYDAIPKDEELLQLVKQFSSIRQTNYDLVVQMLNRASSLMQNRYARENKLIVFRDNHSYTPTYHPNDIEAGGPDIVAILEPINDLLEEDDAARVPWHHILSVIEEKGKLDKNKGPRQSGAYLAFANQCRPDLIGMYGMSISPVGYILQYSCASGLQTSEEFTWANIGPLVSYVYTLYVPHPDFAIRDPSVTLADNGDTLGPPAWNIRDDDKVYENCVVEVVGDPWHRMTWVAKVGDTPITIKDSYRDVHGSFREGELYDILHKEGHAPGFLRVKKEYEVQCARGHPITVTVDRTTRIKTRLIMHTYGQPISKCESLIDFLKCMYDILEAHRWAVLERNIIHRDISHGNIMVHAEDFEDDEKNEFTGEEHRPIFVNGVLTGKLDADPMARLGDMDNAAELDRRKAISPSFVAKKMHMNDEPLRCRTGTPKFIARSPAVGRLLVKNVDFRPMPVLTGEIAEKYAKAYCNDHSEGLRTCFDDASALHGGVYNAEKVRVKHDRNRNLKSTEFEHRPCHDAESVFWCMVVFLLLAVPLGSPPEELGNNPEEDFPLYNAWQYMANHEIGASTNNGDARLRILDDGYWESWLHPELAHVGQLMYLLAVQVDPEWALLEPQPPILHLHEAMQRLILEHIDLWTREKKDVKFDTERSRPTQVPDNRTLPQVSHKHSVNGQLVAASALKPKRQPKRGSNQLEPKEESQPKRRRTTRQGTSSYTEGTYNKATTSYKEGIPLSLPPSPRLFAGRRVTRQSTRLLNKGTGSYKDVGPQSRPPSPRLSLAPGITRQATKASNEGAGSSKDIGPQSLPPSPRLFMGRQLPLEYSLDGDLFERSLPSTPTSPSTNILQLSPPVDLQTLDNDADAEA